MLPDKGDAFDAREADNTLHYKLFQPSKPPLVDIRQYDTFALEVLHYKSADVVENQRYYNLTLPADYSGALHGPLLFGLMDNFPFVSFFHKFLRWLDYRCREKLYC